MLKDEIGQKCRKNGKTNSYSIFGGEHKRRERVLKKLDIGGKTVLH